MLSAWIGLPPVTASISSSVHRMPRSNSTRAGRVAGCQVRSRYASSSTANAEKRERISASAVGAA